MNYRPLLLISLGINVVLVAIIVQKISVPKAPVSRPAAAPSQATAPTVQLPQALPTGSEPRRFGWESVESPDYKQYIANLRAAGCPEETIRDIIEADLIQLYEHKKKQVRKEAPRWEYWKGNDFVRGAGREAWMKMHALDEERDKVLRELGVEPNLRKRALKQQNGNDWVLDFLDDEKKSQMLHVWKEFEDRMQMRDPKDADAWNRLLKEQDAAIKRLLSPEEAFQYDLRMSPIASTLRHQINDMDATEDEFIALYKLRAAQGELPLPGPDAPRSEWQARGKLEKERQEKLQEQIKQTLGPERYADYEMVTDHRYKAARVFADREKLDSQTTRQTYHIRKDAEQAAAAIQADAALASNRRTEALQAIQRETERAMRTTLGDPAWEKYHRGWHGDWLKDIVLAEPQPSKQ